MMPDVPWPPSRRRTRSIAAETSTPPSAGTATRRAGEAAANAPSTVGAPTRAPGPPHHGEQHDDACAREESVGRDGAAGAEPARLGGPAVERGDVARGDVRDGDEERVLGGGRALADEVQDERRPRRRARPKARSRT